MRENKYDDPIFFEKYSQMSRSQGGLSAAGEWESLRALLPPLEGVRMLDLGCGYGWHCIYAMEQGATAAVGVDISHRMLEVAGEKTPFPQVEYLCQPMEEVDFPAGSFDLVLSSLALHYVADYPALVRRVYDMLRPGGTFLFSVEHPIFTAEGSQDWVYDGDGAIRHFPVDRYAAEGRRTPRFLGEEVVKYHRTLTTYLGELLAAGFALTAVVEPQPPVTMLEIPGMRDELRRPMMLIVSAVKR